MIVENISNCDIFLKCPVFHSLIKLCFTTKRKMAVIRKTYSSRRKCPNEFGTLKKNFEMYLIVVKYLHLHE